MEQEELGWPEKSPCFVLSGMDFASHRKWDFQACLDAALVSLAVRSLKLKASHCR